MSSCIVSSCFNLAATASNIRINNYFQFAKLPKLQLAQNQQPKSSCFIVSVVSIYMYSKVETVKKVLEVFGKARVCKQYGRQLYTKILSACREVFVP